MITKESLLTLLGDRPVAYHPILAKKLGGVEVAVFVSQLLYWTGRSKLTGGWIFKTQAELEEETGLTRRNQETARRKSRELGVLSEELRGIPATLHYRLNLDILANLLNQTVQTSLAESAKLECTDQPNSDVRISQTPESIIEYTETTTTGDNLDSNFAEVCQTYQQEIGAISPIISDVIKEWMIEYPHEWILESIGLAVKANVRKTNYISSILRRWKVDGKQEPPKTRNGRTVHKIT